jgi:hypothetical protein
MPGFKLRSEAASIMLVSLIAVLLVIMGNFRLFQKSKGSSKGKSRNINY